MAHQDIGRAAEVAADARNRGWRTFAQGVGVDVALALLTALAAVSVSDIRWTRTYWLVLGASLAKSAVQGLVSALARRAIPPRTAAG